MLNWETWNRLEISYFHSYHYQLTYTHSPNVKREYPQTSNIKRTFVGNEIVDHSDVVGASSVGSSNYTRIFILDLKPGFNWLGKDNYKTRRETFEFLVRLILEVWRYV